LIQVSLIIILAFAYQSILPSIVNYVGPENKKEIKSIILIGTCITCLVYLFWVIAIAGFIKHAGADQIFIDNPTLEQLVMIIKQNNSSSLAVTALNIFLNVTLFASFLTISIAFIDFWIDALKLNTRISGRLIAAGVALIPSLIIAMCFENIFVAALAVSGFAGIAYSIVLPAGVSYRLFDRYNKGGSYFFRGNKNLRGLIFIIAIVFMLFALFY
jgi:amino acid permease